MEDDVVCNYKNCRVQLKDFAWITQCSHIFCDEDGSREFAKCSRCPACETEVEINKTVKRIDLNPSEKYKSVILSGFPPDVIFDICFRAFSFWNYQSQHAIKYQELTVQKNTTKCYELSEFIKCRKKADMEQIQSLKDQLTVAENEFETQLRKANEIYESLMERNRFIQRLQVDCEALQRKSKENPQFFFQSSQSGRPFQSAASCMQSGQDALQGGYRSELFEEFDFNEN